ncbi:MAG TPA: hypothetical protein VM658_20255 [bacterium]|nr:hypothetical protein [bacterium]
MKKKKFDCVKMKHDIQRQILKKFKGISEAEQQRITESRIAADPILGPWWKRMKEGKNGKKAKGKKK